MDSVFRLSEDIETAKQLSCLVLQASQMLVLLNAELARVLKLQCDDIGQLAAGQTFLQPQSIAWLQAQQFIRFYNLIYDKFDGDAVAMRHWLRSESKVLKGVPLLLIIDDGRLEEVVNYLKMDF